MANKGRKDLEIMGITPVVGKWNRANVDNFGIGLEEEQPQPQPQPQPSKGKGKDTSPSGKSKEEEKPTVRTTESSGQTAEVTGVSATRGNSASLQQGHNEGQTYNEYDQAKAKELAAPIIAMQQQAYGADENGKVDPNYWYKVLNIDPEALKKQREADAETARMRAKAAAIGQTFMAANDLFGNLIGARMPKRDKDNTAKEENEKARQMRELVAAEDAARVKDASTRQQAYSTAAAETMMKALDATKTAMTKSDAENVGKQVSSQGTESSQYTNQRGWQSESQFGDRYGGYYDAKLIADAYNKMRGDGYSPEEIQAEMDKQFGTEWRARLQRSIGATSSASEKNEGTTDIPGFGGVALQDNFDEWLDNWYRSQGILK